MKKIIALLLCCMLMLACCSCSSGTKDWQSMTLEGFGTIKVPSDWLWEIEDGYLQFYIINDADVKEYVLIQSAIAGVFNKHLDMVGEEQWLWDINFSNSAGVTAYSTLLTSTIRIKYYKISFSNLSHPYLTTHYRCLNSNVSESTLKRIANSYEMFF